MATEPSSDDTPAGLRDQVVQSNLRYAETFDRGGLDVKPRMGVAVVMCMDARLDAFAALGLEVGDSHVLRNAGGIATDDVIRSLCLSQTVLGTREILLVHHTKCGLEGLHGDAESEFMSRLAARTGSTPSWSFGGFADAGEDVRTSAEKLRASPFVPHTADMSGFVYDVDTGLLISVDLS